MSSRQYISKKSEKISCEHLRQIKNEHEQNSKQPQ